MNRAIGMVFVLIAVTACTSNRPAPPAGGSTPPAAAADPTTNGDAVAVVEGCGASATARSRGFWSTAVAVAKTAPCKPHRPRACRTKCGEPKPAPTPKPPVAKTAPKPPAAASPLFIFNGTADEAVKIIEAMKGCCAGGASASATATVESAPAPPVLRDRGPETIAPKGASTGDEYYRRQQAPEPRTPPAQAPTPTPPPKKPGCTTPGCR